MNESVNENEEKLIINIGEAYMPVVEDYERARESMFKPIYEKGRNIVKELCEAYVNKNTTNGCNTNSENYNNIIAFTGERGSGKTSSMLTFSDLLNNEEFLRNGLSTNIYDKDRIEFKFVQNDVIDPSQFDKNVNILEIILASMFKNFKNKADKIESTDRQKIIECFDKVYRNLKTLKKESSSIYDGDVLEALLEMSASMEIKENLSKLISVYLEKVENENNKRSIFVVRIDDIDLNTKYAYDMVEQLRKYLMLPRVIILMALKIDQLHDVVNQSHYISLAALSNMENNDNNEKRISIKSKVIDMTEKYLSKLFPIDHRLLMPEPELSSSSKKFEIRTNLNEKGIEYPSLDYGIREIIYRKTGLHFIKPDKNENPIVPSNLRELVNFVHYLQKFEDVKITSKEKLIRCMNAIIKNESGNTILDDEIQKKLQTTGKTLEEFSWLLDCPLEKNNYDWEVLLCENEDFVNLKLFGIRANHNKLKNELEKINDEDKNNILTKKQLEEFKNYFLSYWCQNKLSSDGKLIIKRFLSYDNKQKNKFIVSELEKTFNIINLWENQRENMISKDNRFDSKTNIFQKIESYIEEYKKIYSVINYDLNISIGDVFFLISMLEKLSISNEVQNLIFAIKTVYYIELELLSLTNINENQLFQESKYLVGGEYYSSFQKQIITNEKISGESRSLRTGNLPRIIEETESLEYIERIATILFMNLMFSRAGNINENYRINDEVYYDFYEKLNGRQVNYVLSITSPFFNSHRVNQFIDSKIFDEYKKKDIYSLISINNMEKYISNIILLEYLFIEKIGDKKLSFTNPRNITSCWYEFYESLNSRMRFFDGISYFSIFNMNFMKVFRKSNIKNINNINILESKIEKLIENMEKDSSSKKQLQNYWREYYLAAKKDISASEEIQLDVLNNYITEMIFFRTNESNTSIKVKRELIDILKSVTFNNTEEINVLLNKKDKEFLEKNPEKKSEYARKYSREAKLYLFNKNYNKSIEFYMKAIELDSKNPLYWSDLGIAYFHRKNNGDCDKEINAYIKAIEFSPENPMYWHDLGESYYDRKNEGDYDKAIESYTKASELDPKNAIYWIDLGKAYYIRKNKGDLEQAINCFETALNQKNVSADLIEETNTVLSKCQEELNSIESQTEEPTETNLEDSEPKDNE